MADLNTEVPDDLAYMQFKFGLKGLPGLNRLSFVTPEMFLTGSNVIGTSTAIDNAAMALAVATGLPVWLSNGATYKFSQEFSAPGGKDLIVKGETSGVGGPQIEIQGGFTGFLFKPLSGYDLSGFRVSGNNLDGCYIIGNSGTGSSFLAKLGDIYLNQCDIAVYFGASWQHPLGINYDRTIYVQYVRSGGIVIGGATGVTSNGESCWDFGNLVLTNANQPGIAAPSVVVAANSPDSTHDAISWDNSVTPLFGWLVMRSADGLTGWHVPPNWTSPYFTGASFSAAKTVGQTWNYTVVRMTRGLSVRRGKVINSGAMQAEYFGAGVYVDNIAAFSFGPIYTEHRDPTGGAVPRPNLASAIAVDSYGEFAGGWVEKASYGYICRDNAAFSLGPVKGSNLFYSVMASGGATEQYIHAAGVRPFGTTPSAKSNPDGGAYNNGYSLDEYDTTTGLARRSADGTQGGKFVVRSRGVDKAALEVTSAFEGKLTADRSQITLPSKTLLPQSVNNARYTALTSGVATAFMTLDLGANNGFSALHVPFAIYVADSGFVGRQVVSGHLDIAAVNASSGNVAAAVTAAFAKAAQAGTIGDPAFTVSVAANVATISVNCTSSVTTPAVFRIYPGEPLAMEGIVSPTALIL